MNDDRINISQLEYNALILNRQQLELLRDVILNSCDYDTINDQLYIKGKQEAVIGLFRAMFGGWYNSRKYELMKEKGFDNDRQES